MMDNSRETETEISQIAKQLRINNLFMIIKELHDCGKLSDDKFSEELFNLRKYI